MLLQKLVFLSNLSIIFLVLVLLLSPLSPKKLARAQLQDCYFQGLNLLPCLSSGNGNISEECCRSLNLALDAGHHCLCSLLLSTNLLVTLNTPLSTLPFVLPLPGCNLYSPSLAACKFPLQTTAPPVADMEPAIPPPPRVAVTASSWSELHGTRTESKDRDSVLSSSDEGEFSKIAGGTYKIIGCVMAVYAWIVY